MAKQVVVIGWKWLAGSMTELFGVKGILGSVLAGIMLTGISAAQNSSRAQESESHNSPVLAALLHTPGSAAPQPQNTSDRQARIESILADALKTRTPVRVSLMKPVDARKDKPGAEVIARTTQEIRSADGEVVVSAGATIVGLTREVTLRSPDGQEADIEIAVNHVLLTDGTKTSLAHALHLLGHSRLNDSRDAEHEAPIDQQARTVDAMRALATPASMGGGMLRDGMTMLDTSGNPAQKMEANKSLGARNDGLIPLPDLYLSAEISGKTDTAMFNATYTRLRLGKGTEMILRVREQ